MKTLRLQEIYPPMADNSNLFLMPALFITSSLPDA
jgi:hypothetical protein